LLANVQHKKHGVACLLLLLLLRSCRYPSPSWWINAEVFELANLTSTIAAAAKSCAAASAAAFLQVSCSFLLEQCGGL
jgi:hypothetical protein